MIFWAGKHLLLYRNLEVAITTLFPGNKLSRTMTARMLGLLFEVKVYFQRT